MVQAYLPTVDTEGETALVFFGDRFSLVIELELIEPSLFQDVAPAGAPRLADELRERVAR
jgi:hypothetical protein